MDDMQSLDAAPLVLVPLTQAHAPALFEVLVDPQIYRHLDERPPTSVEALQGRYRRLEARRSPDGAQHWLNWAVSLPGQAPMGYVQATVVAPDRAWVAYVLGSRYWGRGYASLAMQAVLEHLANRYRVVSCMAVVEAANARSIRLLERLGFGLASAAEAAAQGLTASERLYLR
jgi:ribosomal-protein-alanine N-acetyltransferase